MDETRISVDKLRVAVNRVLDHVVEVDGDTVALRHDYFWSIPDEQMYDVCSQPDVAQFTIGQLTESWRNVDDMLESDSDVLAYHLVWLADILRAVGTEVAR